MERSETLTGSASTAASSQTPSGMANSWEACAAKRSACAPAAAAQFPRWIEAGRAPARKLRHHGYRPSRHASHGGSTPRGTQDSQGLSTTRSPVSSRRPTASWPSTCGKDTSAVSGLSREPFSRICFTSEPHRPENVVLTPTQSAPGSGCSATSSMRTGARRETNARRSTRPPMAEAASRARLCRNTSAFTSTLLRRGSSKLSWPAHPVSVHSRALREAGDFQGVRGQRLAGAAAGRLGVPEGGRGDIVAPWQVAAVAVPAKVLEGHPQGRGEVDGVGAVPPVHAEPLLRPVQPVGPDDLVHAQERAAVRRVAAARHVPVERPAEVVFRPGPADGRELIVVVQVELDLALA